MSDMDGLELNLVFNAPKAKPTPSERTIKRAEFRAKKAAPAAARRSSSRGRHSTSEATPSNHSAVESKDEFHSSNAASTSSKPVTPLTKPKPKPGRPNGRQRTLLKRKAALISKDTPKADGETEEKTTDAVDPDADGDEEMKENDDEPEIVEESKEEAWKAIKQARFEGDTSVKSSAPVKTTDSTTDSTAPTDSSSATPAASTTTPTTPKKFVKTSKPLPKIVRHAPAQLDAAALKPITPENTQNKEVFAIDPMEVDDDENDSDDSDTKVKKEGEEPTVKEELTPLPTTGFGALGLTPRLVRCLVEKMMLKFPTKIQKEGIPLLLDSKKKPDALIKSETGTGKTLTYLIPVVERLLSEPERVDRAQGTRAIILSPTRELCLQIHGVLSNLLEKGQMYWIVSGVIMGGEKKNKEKSRLRKGINILICTPGRLLDHLENTECFVLSKLSFFILDEADRLMDMGFEKDLTKIVELLDSKSQPKLPTSAIIDPRTGLEIKSAKTKQAEAERLLTARRQNILVSATLNKEIELMASITLKNPILIGFKTAPVEDGVKMEDDEGNALVNGNQHIQETSMPKGLVQLYLQVEHRHKIVALASLLRKKVVESEMNNTHFKAVVFFSTCASVEFHHELFRFSYWPYDRSQGGADVEKMALLDTSLMKLHGNLTQSERTRTYQQFCKNAEGILLCTDVAARGLDLPAVDYIFQYDPPEDTADYIHRVGRTARMGRKGQAILFLTSSEMDYLTILKDKGIVPEPLSFAHILQSLHSDAAKNRIYDDARGGSPAGAILQKQFENLVNGQVELKESAINGYHSYLRAYAAYPKQLKGIFHPKKLHIGHVARSFGLNDAPTQLAQSEIVSKQRTNEAREKEREKERREIPGGDRHASDSIKKRFVPAPASKPSSNTSTSSNPSASADETISSGVRPAFGGRDRARNVVAQANDAAFEQRKREKKPKLELSTIGWKLGTEGASSGTSTASKLSKTGIDRVRSLKVAQVFKKKKVDLASEFAS